MEGKNRENGAFRTYADIILGDERVEQILTEYEIPKSYFDTARRCFTNKYLGEADARVRLDREIEICRSLPALERDEIHRRIEIAVKALAHQVARRTNYDVEFYSAAP